MDRIPGRAEGDPDSTTPDSHGSAAATATVELSRRCDLAGLWCGVMVTVDGESVGRIRAGETRAYHVEPGVHQMRVRDLGIPPRLWSRTVSFEVAAGAKACLECGFDPIGRVWLRRSAQ